MNRIVIAILLACLLTTAAQAQFVKDQATFNHADCNNPVLASSPDGQTMMAYWASGDPLLVDFVQVQAMPTRGTGSAGWPAPLTLGTGGQPAICWSRAGFHAAFASGPVILVYHSDLDGNWDLINYDMFNANGNVVSIDLLGIASDAAGPDVFMTVNIFIDQVPSFHRILYGSHNSYGWSELEIVREGPQFLWPKITWTIGPAGPYPMIFFLEPGIDFMDLKSTFLVLGEDWSDPVLIPDSLVAQEFDVVTHANAERNILGLGPAPACPCGSISHQAYSSAWETPEYMTAHYADYDWPFSPSIAAAPDGKVHAFWMQYASAPDFTPWYNSLEYRVLEDGVWTNEGDFLNEPGHGGPFGARVAITAQPSAFPVLAWTRRDTIDLVPQPMQIWVARQPAPSAVPQGEMARPELALTAWPNPFNPVVNMAFEVNQAQTARLDVFDARGCRVAGLLNEVVNSGRVEISWAGKDDTGRSLPSGVYFARLVSGDQRAVLKIVLAE